jgi:hypothetical protein
VIRRLKLDRVLTYRIVSTDNYHAMYRVLEAFSLFNTILGAWGICNMNPTQITNEFHTYSVGFPFLLIGSRT